MFQLEWAIFRELHVQKYYGGPYVKQTGLKSCVIITVIYKHRLKLLEIISCNYVFPRSSCLALCIVNVLFDPKMYQLLKILINRE